MLNEKFVTNTVSDMSHNRRVISSQPVIPRAQTLEYKNLSKHMSKHDMSIYENKFEFKLLIHL
jgi:hypothetical protein